ncbi:MAG: DUF885 family protein [Gammaproteobacteria bacterium]|nr:DUF885 family protein [Gammaproteobacteria bacterium]
MRRYLERTMMAALGVLYLAGCASGNGVASQKLEAEQTAERPGTGPLVRRMETSLAETLIQRGIEKLVSTYPELASRLGEPNGNWNPPGRSAFSDEVIIEMAGRLEAAVDPLQIPARLRHDIAHLAFGAAIARTHRDLPARIDINPATGPHVRLTRFPPTHHSIDTESAAEAWEQRLAAIDDYTHALINDAAATGTRLIGGETIARQCRALNEHLEGTDDHFLIEDFAIRASQAGKQSPARIDEIRTIAETTFANACRDLSAFARRGDSPINEEPVRYRAALARATSLEPDPQSLHDRALRVLEGLDLSIQDSSAIPSRQRLLDRASGVVFDVEGELGELTSIAPSVDLDVALIRAPFETASTGGILARSRSRDRHPLPEFGRIVRYQRHDPSLHFARRPPAAEKPDRNDCAHPGIRAGLGPLQSDTARFRTGNTGFAHRHRSGANRRRHRDSRPTMGSLPRNRIRRSAATPRLDIRPPPGGTRYRRPGRRRRCICRLRGISRHGGRHPAPARFTLLDQGLRRRPDRGGTAPAQRVTHESQKAGRPEKLVCFTPPPAISSTAPPRGRDGLMELQLEQQRANRGPKAADGLCFRPNRSIFNFDGAP